jgi:hypothetical protein
MPGPVRRGCHVCRLFASRRVQEYTACGHPVSRVLRCAALRCAALRPSMRCCAVLCGAVRCGRVGRAGAWFESRTFMLYSVWRDRRGCTSAGAVADECQPAARCAQDRWMHARRVYRQGGERDRRRRRRGVQGSAGQCRVAGRRCGEAYAVERGRGRGCGCGERMGRVAVAAAAAAVAQCVGVYSRILCACGLFANMSSAISCMFGSRLSMPSTTLRSSSRYCVKQRRW